jgi:aryl-alcohol dehydrogenase-like predicted oxidoreductase
LKVFGKIFSRDYGAEYRERIFDSESTIRSLHASLKRLRTDYIDFFFVHEPRHMTDFQTTADLTGLLERQREKGTIRHYGIAGPSELFLEACDRGHRFGDTAQFQISANSPALVASAWNSGSLFAYGLFRHLGAAPSGGRLEYEPALQWFFSTYPNVVPLIATTRPEALNSLQRAIAALQ